jgi:hypothetical protein
LLLLLGVGYWMYRGRTSDQAAPQSAGVAAAFRTPEKVVAERRSLKEGDAMMYSFSLQTDSRIEVNVASDRKNVDVMLITADELARYGEARGKLFGGAYSHRQALSREGVLHMKETEVVPAGRWAIVVQVPQESMLIMDETTISVDFTAY